MKLFEKILKESEDCYYDGSDDDEDEYDDGYYDDAEITYDIDECSRDKVKGSIAFGGTKFITFISYGDHNSKGDLIVDVQWYTSKLPSSIADSLNYREINSELIETLNERADGFHFEWLSGNIVLVED